ncbi:MAG: MoaD/ThiS family protein [Chloroflexi bacterium]|nr:MoaD/ThiS family protein [Chloroflexota bacterium]
MGAVRVLLPEQLRGLFDAPRALEPEATSVADVIDASYPGMRARRVEPSGELRPCVNVFMGVEDARWLQGASTPVTAGAEVPSCPAWRETARASERERVDHT